MKANHKLAIALAAGIAIGGGAIGALQAKTPPAYVVVDISEISDPEGFKAILPISSPAYMAKFPGKYIIRTQDITAVDGPAPQRFVVIEFDSTPHAQAFLSADTTKTKIDAIRAKTTKSREFLVGGM